mmetsp:Transcript_4428/g.12390  ORF Transcript_4428/g.12390 Transcript_4428/m.12390 type:complete len:108 (+) Transcript_4428:984-1307(+)
MGRRWRRRQSQLGERRWWRRSGLGKWYRRMQIIWRWSCWHHVRRPEEAAFRLHVAKREPEKESFEKPQARSKGLKKTEPFQTVGFQEKHKAQKQGQGQGQRSKKGER